MDACIVQRHYDFSLDVTQEMLEESDDISTSDRPQRGVLEEVPVGRDRANGGESFSQLAGSVIRGVTPLIAHVRRLTPLSENPTSSR
ncbi:hypothetical protein QR90_09680 [Deinococcus radiopugnans]|uniref:Uncharacterized protein n=1 Tax=Deinococcus radiopugnans TaxID=57497 RepID=A0A0A7KGM1_9DEIO|nr:hypothetical protein QR90_09680 [Deinococcus radiopugnans]